MPIPTTYKAKIYTEIPQNYDLLGKKIDQRKKLLSEPGSTIGLTMIAMVIGVPIVTAILANVIEPLTSKEYDTSKIGEAFVPVVIGLFILIGIAIAIYQNSVDRKLKIEISEYQEEQKLYLKRLCLILNQEIIKYDSEEMMFENSEVEELLIHGGNNHKLYTGSIRMGTCFEGVELSYWVRY